MYEKNPRSKKNKKQEEIIDLDDIDDDDDDNSSDGQPALLLDDPELDELDLYDELEYKGYHQRNKSVNVDEFIIDL